MLWVKCGKLRERMGALFENIAVRYDCLSDHSTCSHFRFGSVTAGDLPRSYDCIQPLQDMSHKRSYPNTHHAYPACMGCAWSWMPSAAVTFRIVAKLGLPSPDNAL